MTALEIAKDIGIVAVRIVTILPLLLFFTLFMGKRSIGELPVFDFLAILTLGSVVGADIADPEIEHLPTIAAIFMIALLQKILAKWKVSNRRMENLVTFEPNVIIENGVLLSDAIKKNQFTIDNVLALLREKDIFHLSQVELAVIEGSGKLSVFKKTSGPVIKEAGFPLIVEGKVFDEVLEFFETDRSWLDGELLKQGFESTDDVFFASITKNKFLQVSPKHAQAANYPPFLI
ncbi:DUF421 domain-containing protein [Metabacillus indicus]|uniref:DUF421 domain-containing protein n=1 Tax=Metabacillus indicus TaxID=246786 RepID=UPI00398456B3